VCATALCVCVHSSSHLRTRPPTLIREVQVAVGIAQARDTVQIFGSVWLLLVTGLVSAKAAGKHVPKAAGIPVVVGGTEAGYMWLCACACGPDCVCPPVGV
jgi:hypothetical protein